MNVDELPQLFLAESRELLAAMEGALLTLEQSPRDLDAINAVFRAAHTIKGSAGVIGFDALIEFTHVMENVLDEVRAGHVSVDAHLIALLLACGDHLSLLLDCFSAEDSHAAFAHLQQQHTELQGQLNGYLKTDVAGVPQVKGETAGDPVVQPLSGTDTVANDA